jgi:hypothetical protein
MIEYKEIIAGFIATTDNLAMIKKKYLSVEEALKILNYSQQSEAPKTEVKEVDD